MDKNHFFRPFKNAILEYGRESESEKYRLLSIIPDRPMPPIEEHKFFWVTPIFD